MPRFFSKKRAGGMGGSAPHGGKFPHGGNRPTQKPSPCEGEGGPSPEGMVDEGILSLCDLILRRGSPLPSPPDGGATSPKGGGKWRGRILTALLKHINVPIMQYPPLALPLGPVPGWVELSAKLTERATRNHAGENHLPPLTAPPSAAPAAPYTKTSRCPPPPQAR